MPDRLAGSQSVHSSPRQLVSRLFRRLTRPVRGGRERQGVLVQPFRGYGSRDRVFLIGRVFRQPAFGWNARDGGLRRRATDLLRSVLRRGIGGAVLEASLYGAEQRVVTDEDGYFRIELRLEEPPRQGRLWHRMALCLTDPVRIDANAEIFIAPGSVRQLVISDIDDTIMHTGVASKLMMFWRLFMRGARSRTAFPGIAAFLRALHSGASGGEANPLLYVSRGPWSLYGVLDEFFNLHRIPIGPLLFLREWGLTLQSPLPRRAEDHKLSLIRHMLDLYRDLPVVLIGDSGQHDPEVYAEIVREHPGRVTAVYIRSISGDPERHRAIERLGADLAVDGCALLLAADTSAMAEHAVGHGLIAQKALAVVKGERLSESDEDESHPLRTVTWPASEPSADEDVAGAEPLPDDDPRKLAVEPEPRR